MTSRGGRDDRPCNELNWLSCRSSTTLVGCEGSAGLSLVWHIRLRVPAAATGCPVPLHNLTGAGCDIEHPNYTVEREIEFHAHMQVAYYLVAFLIEQLVDKKVASFFYAPEVTFQQVRRGIFAVNK